jgi:hypothetical protein
MPNAHDPKLEFIADQTWYPAMLSVLQYGTAATFTTGVDTQAYYQEPPISQIIFLCPLPVDYNEIH